MSQGGRIAQGSNSHLAALQRALAVTHLTRSQLNRISRLRESIRSQDSAEETPMANPPARFRTQN